MFNFDPFKFGAHPEPLNIGVIIAILAYMIALYTHDLVTGRKSALIHEQNHATANVFWFFFAAMTCILGIYLILAGSGGLAQACPPPKESNDLVHQLIHIAISVLSNVSNLCLLTTAIAYSGAKQFKLRQALNWFVPAVLFILLWASVWELVDHRATPLFTSLMIAPDIVIANVSMVALGWVFFARWKGSSIFFIVTVIYALLQLPARIGLEMRQFLTADYACSLDFAFYLLAAGKLAIAYWFLALLCRSTSESFHEPKYWPLGERPHAHLFLPFVAQHQLGWLIQGVVHLAIAIFFAAVGHGLWEWAYSHFSH